MTVVAILWTLAVVYVLDAFGTSRDAARITSVSQIIENMDLFKIDNWRYPNPDNSVTVTLSGAELWKQWEFWLLASQSLWVYGSEYPQDPLYEYNYSYSVTNNDTEYQVWAILEDTKGSLDNGVTAMIIPQAYAEVTTAYVRWNYNWFLARAIIWWNHHFVSTPSIIASDLSDTDVRTIIDNERLVFDQFFNLPSVYNEFVDTYWGFAFFPSEPVIFSGALSELQNRDTLTDFINEMKFTYASSQISTFETYQNLIEGDTYTSTKKLLENVFGVPFAAHSCNDILANWEWLSDGYYVVDSDEWEDGSVYCDMTTSWWGWTRVWIDYITNWEFEWWNHIESEWGSNSNNNIVDLWTENTPVVSEYALHQTSSSWWSSDGKSKSEYEVHFNDADPVASGYQFPAWLLQPWHEIRMTAWVRDDDNGATWVGCNTGPCNHNPYQGYIFHNRLFYTDGTNEVNGTVEVLDTVTTEDGAEWELQRVRKKIRKTPNRFDWYIWYGAELETDLYFTGVKLEIFYK